MRITKSREQKCYEKKVQVNSTQNGRETQVKWMDGWTDIQIALVCLLKSAVLEDHVEEFGVSK